jgi:putative oxidoreductase
MLDPIKLAGAAFLATTRAWVGWQFLKSGWLKLSDWDTTIELFTHEYRVPLLAPGMAAFAATAGELLFPLLLMAGLLTRPAALGLFVVNVMALVSYWHVLGQDGFEAARAQHLLWGYMLGVVAVFGAGPWSMDFFLARRRAPSAVLAAN